MANILKNKGSHRILAIMAGLDGENPLQLIEIAGRTAYQSRDKITDESAAIFVKMLRDRGHESVLEHSCMTVEFNNVCRGFCYDEKTQILTREGWKYFKDVDISKDYFATLNLKTENLEYQKAIDRTDVFWNSKMYKVKSSMVDLLVTPNHRMVVRKPDRRRSGAKQSLFIAQTQEIVGKRICYKKNANWKGCYKKFFSLPKVKTSKHGTKIGFKVEMNTFLQFLGYYLSDGGLSDYKTTKEGRTGGVKVRIAQHKRLIKQKIAKICKKLQFNVKIEKSGISFSNYVLVQYLRKFGKKENRFIPKFIKALAPKQIKYFVQAYIEGDGNIHKKNHHRVIYTSSSKIADDLQELFLKMGESAKIRVDNRIGDSHVLNRQVVNKKILSYIISVSQANRCEPRINTHGRKHDSFVKYKGMVRCVTVPNGTLYVRRNGIPVWCGNTHELVRHRLASFTQESTRYVDESNFKAVVPPDKDPNEKLVELDFPNGTKIKVSFQEWMDLNEQMYRGLRKADWLPEDARQVLPTAIKAQIVMTANFREWRHVFKLRTAPNAHWEIRQVMTNLLNDVKQRIPVMFDDI